METIINASRVRAMLKEQSEAPTVGKDAVDWVNKQAMAAVNACASGGFRYPSGRLSCPPPLMAAETPGGAALGLLRRMVEKHEGNPKYAETDDYKAAVAILARTAK